MNKKVLSIEQMKHLQELGLDTSKASMCYVVDDCNSFNPILCISGQESEYLDAVSYPIPTFILQDILDFLPDEIKNEEGNNYFLTITKYTCTWEIDYELISFDSKNIIDAAYEMLCWCIKNKYINNE